MHEGVMRELAQAGVAVIARTSVMQYVATEKPVRDIARELDVDAVIEASVSRTGDSVLIDARLVDPSTQEYLWFQSYEAAFRGLVALQRQLARAIADEIQLALTPQAEARLAGAPEVNQEAYELYLKGRFHTWQLSPEDLETALQYFQLALEINPDFALAHAGISDVWNARGTVGIMPNSEALPFATTAVEKAIQLDDGLAEAHASLAGLRAFAEYDWAGAEAAYERAIEINPNYADARFFYGTFLTGIERAQEATMQMERGLELDPLNPLFQTLYGQHFLFLRRYDDAIVQLRKTLSMAPGVRLARANLWQAFHQKEMYEEVLAEWRIDHADDQEVAGALERGYAQAGYPGASLSVAETLAARSNETYVGPIPVAGYFAIAGDNDRALEWLEKAYEERIPDMVFLGVRPVWDNLRDDRRFQDLMRRMNLPE
jgi:tetratricopeptide (TPR) repeat protein